jgi:hypothetical protein
VCAHLPLDAATNSLRSRPLARPLPAAAQGCFHVPRALLYCEQAFAALLARAGEGE